MRRKPRAWYALTGILALLLIGTAFVRVCVTEYWTTSTAQLTGSTGVKQNWAAAWDDFELHDGWYYYKWVLPRNGSVKVLDSVTFPDTVVAGASYHLDFQVEMVQASDEPAVNADATRTLFGRTGTISSMVTTFGAVTDGQVTWTS